MPKTRQHKSPKPISHRVHPARRWAFLFVGAFTLVMIAVGLSRLFAAQAAYTLSPASQSATSGQTKSVSVNVNTGSTGVRYGTVEVQFKASLLSVTDFSASTSPFTVFDKQSGPGVYRFKYYAPAGDAQGSFRLGTFSFKTSPVSGSTTATISFNSAATTALSSTVGNLSVSLTSAAITVNPSSPPPGPSPTPSPSPSPTPNPTPNPPPKPSPTPSPAPSPHPTPSPSPSPAPSPVPTPTPAPAPSSRPNPAPALPSNQPPGSDLVNQPWSELPGDIAPPSTPATARRRALLVGATAGVLAALAAALYLGRHRLALVFGGGLSNRSKPKARPPRTRDIGKATMVASRVATPLPTPPKVEKKAELPKIRPIHKTLPISKPIEVKTASSPAAPTPPATAPPERRVAPLPPLTPTPTPQPHAVIEDLTDVKLQAAITPEVLQGDGEGPPLTHTAWEEIRSKQAAALEARKKKSILDEDAPDMFEVAQEHPESFGNTHYSDPPPQAPPKK